MSNPRWNNQNSNPREADKAPVNKGSEKALVRPSFEQPTCTTPKQKPLGEGFKSTKEMVDKL